MQGVYSDDGFETPSTRKNSSSSTPPSGSSNSLRTTTTTPIAPQAAVPSKSATKSKPIHLPSSKASSLPPSSAGGNTSQKGIVKPTASGASSSYKPPPKPAPAATRNRANSTGGLRLPTGTVRRNSKEETLLEAAMAAHTTTSPRRRISVGSLPDFASKQQPQPAGAPSSPEAYPMIKIDSSFVAFPKSPNRASPVTDNNSGSSGERDTPFSPNPHSGGGSLSPASPNEEVKKTMRRLSAAGLTPAPGYAGTKDESGASSKDNGSTQPPNDNEYGEEGRGALNPPNVRASPWQDAQYRVDIADEENNYDHYEDDFDDGPGEGNDGAAAEQALFGFEEQLRHTPEYRVAWDLELWKAVQKKKAEKEVKDFKRRLQDEARGSLLIQEKEIKREMEKTLKELSTRQKKLEEDEARQEKRRVRLLEAEKELDRRMTALSDQRRRVEEDADARAKRLKAEYTHREEIVNSKLHQTEEALKRSEERLQVSQKEYMRLWEDFSAFKTRQLTERNEAPETAAMERLRQQHHYEMIQLNERLEREHRGSINNIIERLETSHQEVSKLNRQLASGKERIRHLEQLNNRLGAQLEAQAVTAQQRSADTIVHEHRNQLGINDLTSAVQNAFNSATGRTRHSAKGSSGATTHITNIVERPAEAAQRLHRGEIGAVDTNEVQSQIRLWSIERSRLLEMSGGAYTASSDVIVALDKRIRHARAQLASAQ